MKIRRQNFLVFRFLCLLMAFHVVNISIDTTDMTSLSGRSVAHHKDLSINEIESISELILETCLGIVDAVPEHDDPDGESELAELEQDYSFAQPFHFRPARLLIHFMSMGNLSFRPAHIPSHVSEIIAPPPR